MRRGIGRKSGVSLTLGRKGWVPRSQVKGKQGKKGKKRKKRGKKGEKKEKKRKKRGKEEDKRGIDK